MFSKAHFQKIQKALHLSTPTTIHLWYVIYMQILFVTMDEHPVNFKHRAQGPICIFRMVQIQWHPSEFPTKNRPLVQPHGSKGTVFQQWVFIFFKVGVVLGFCCCCIYCCYICFLFEGILNWNCSLNSFKLIIWCKILLRIRVMNIISNTF